MAKGSRLVAVRIERMPDVPATFGNLSSDRPDHPSAKSPLEFLAAPWLLFLASRTKRHVRNVQQMQIPVSPTGMSWPLRYDPRRPLSYNPILIPPLTTRPFPPSRANVVSALNVALTFPPILAATPPAILP